MSRTGYTPTGPTTIGIIGPVGFHSIEPFKLRLINLFKDEIRSLSLKAHL